MIINLFGGTIYVKVSRNKFTVKHIESNNEITVSAEKPFTTSRLLVGQFIVAEALLKEAIKKAYLTNWISPSPIVLIQPITMIDDGLSEVEERVLRELASSSGARKVVVWVGKVLSNEEVIAQVKRT